MIFQLLEVRKWRITLRAELPDMVYVGLLLLIGHFRILLPRSFSDLPDKAFVPEFRSVLDASHNYPFGFRTT